MFRRTAVEEKDGDLGFGSLARQFGTRLVNRDGSFAVAKIGRDWRAALSVYHTLLTTSWSRFLLLAAAIFFAFNLVFGLAYRVCGTEAVAGPETGGPFLRAFFLAVQTSSTVGYGQLAPAGLAANLVMVVQAFLSLVLVALGAGMTFARFSRPRADIAWSDRAVVAPYRGTTGFMVRIANRRRSEILDLNARLMLSFFVEEGGVRKRTFHELELERSKVSFLPLSWTIVHPIGETSPLHGITAEDFAARQGEVIVLLQGHDATTSQDLYDWTSYTREEITFGARFARIFDRGHGGGPIRMDVGRIHDIEPLSSTEEGG